MRRAGLDTEDLHTFYCSIVRPTIEYAAPLWHTSLNIADSNKLENIQKRALRIILPGLPYLSACETLNIPTLAQRRTDICRSFFKSMTVPSHRLNNLLPRPRDIGYNIRNRPPLPLPKVKTKRFKNCIVQFGLFNYQWFLKKYLYLNNWLLNYKDFYHTFKQHGLLSQTFNLSFFQLLVGLSFERLFTTGIWQTFKNFNVSFNFFNLNTPMYCYPTFGLQCIINIYYYYYYKKMNGFQKQFTKMGITNMILLFQYSRGIGATNVVQYRINVRIW